MLYILNIKKPLIYRRKAYGGWRRYQKGANKFLSLDKLFMTSDSLSVIMSAQFS